MNEKKWLCAIEQNMYIIHVPCVAYELNKEQMLWCSLEILYLCVFRSRVMSYIHLCRPYDAFFQVSYDCLVKLPVFFVG